MTLTYHIFSSPRLRSSLRSSISSLPQPPPFKSLESISLLASMYAETLRFGVQIHVPRSAPYHELNVGGVTIPRDKMVMVNTWLAHTDENIWNTKQGKHPLDHFWAERFLVDPNDATSGPTRQENEAAAGMEKSSQAESIRFSIEGLDGSWIPFGGTYARYHISLFLIPIY